MSWFLALLMILFTPQQIELTALSVSDPLDGRWRVQANYYGPAVGYMYVTSPKLPTEDLVLVDGDCEVASTARDRIVACPIVDGRATATFTVGRSVIGEFTGGLTHTIHVVDVEPEICPWCDLDDASEVLSMPVGDS